MFHGDSVIPGGAGIKYRVAFLCLVLRLRKSGAGWDDGSPRTSPTSPALNGAMLKQRLRQFFLKAGQEAKKSEICIPGQSR
jgi:hypothetical protein